MPDIKKVTFDTGDYEKYVIQHGELRATGGNPGACGASTFNPNYSSYELSLRVELPVVADVLSVTYDRYAEVVNPSSGGQEWYSGLSRADGSGVVGFNTIFDAFNDEVWIGVNAASSTTPPPWKGVTYFYIEAFGFLGNIRVDNIEITYIPSKGNSGESDCPCNHHGEPSRGNPIGIYSGEKREQVTDLVVNTPAGPLAFTRSYRQSQQGTLQALGLGWTHNHKVSLTFTAGTPNEILIRTPNGGETYLTETSPGSNSYQATPGSVSTVTYNPATSQYTLTAEDKSTYMFDSAGKLLSKTWPSGLTWHYHYTNGLLDQVYDDYGHQLKLTYIADLNTGPILWRVGDQDATGLDTGSPAGRYAEFTYTPQKNNGVTISNPKALLASVRDVLGNIWTYDYYGQNVGETSQLDFLSKRRSPSVDTTGDGTPDGALVQEDVTYTVSSGSITAITQRRGYPQGSDPNTALLKTDFAFQPSGQNVTTETIAGKTTTHQFASNVYTGTTDPAGNLRQELPDAQFRPGSQTDPNGNQTQLAWSADGKHLDRVTDALSNQTNFNYNANDTLNYSLDAEGRKTQYVYGDPANVRLPTEVKLLDTNGTTVLRWQKFTYDTYGRTLTEQIVDPANSATVLQQVTRVYWQLGQGNDSGVGLLRTLTQEDLGNSANNVTITYLYDSAGRVVQANQTTAFGACNISRTVYDLAGNVVAAICNYDNLGGPAPTTAAEAATLATNTSDLTKNQVTTYDYDSLGRVAKVTTNAGRVAYTQATLTAYDALNRVIRTIANYVSNVGVPNPYTALRSAFNHGTNNDQNLVTDLAYNERGMVKSQTDALGNVTLFGYDDAGRLIKTIQSASQPTYNNTYGVGGDPTLASYVASSAVDKDIVMTNQYDKAGNLVKIVDPLGNVMFTIYDALNRPVKTVRNAKDSATIVLNVGDPGYDATNDPRSASYAASAAVDRDLIEVVEYDAMGRVKRSQDVIGSWTLFGYDGQGRQVKVVRSASNPTYNSTADPSLSSYSASGNADQDIITLTAYDLSGRVMNTTDALGQRAWYGYDGLNRLVKTIVNAVGTAPMAG